MTQLMNSMGINPRPTVAEWIQQKNEQKKTAMQEALINWDRGKRTRETAILLQQTITSQRAMKHAAWGARKDINSKMKVLKSTPYRQQPSLFPSPPKQSRKATAPPNRNKATGKLKTPTANLKQQRTGNAATGSKPRSKTTKPTPAPCMYVC